MDDLVSLVLSDHVRIDRLFGELEGAANSPARLAALWADLSRALVAHIGAFEEICKLPLLQAVPESSTTVREISAQRADICDAVADARLHEAGSPQWWLAVRAARTAADSHINSAEDGPLRRFAQRAPESVRQDLGRQWNQFVTDLSADGRESLFLYRRATILAR